MGSEAYKLYRMSGCKLTAISKRCIVFQRFFALDRLINHIAKTARFLATVQAATDARCRWLMASVSGHVVVVVVVVLSNVDVGDP